MKYRAVRQLKLFRRIRDGFQRVKRKIAVTALIVLTLFMAGCPLLPNPDGPKKSMSADKLFKIAEDNFRNKDFAEAADTYEQLISAHPDFKKAAEVYLKIGDAYFNNGSYGKAIAAYNRFVELYPAHKEVPRAEYQIAMGSFKRIKSIDLDSRIIKRAAADFKKLADDPNGGEWAKKAEEKYRRCQQKLGEKQLYTARTYISVSNYKAARLAAQRVLDDYANLGLDKEANNLLKEIKNK
jgi:outer membrane protein assembly factor BamD